MSIEKFINRLKYGFYTIERIENIADQRIGLITHGLVCGLICNLLSIIGLKYMISLGAVPLCTIMVAALFLDLYIMYIIEKKYFKDGKRQLLSLEERQHFLYQARLRFSAPSHSRIKSDRFFL